MIWILIVIQTVNYSKRLLTTRNGMLSVSPTVVEDMLISLQRMTAGLKNLSKFTRLGVPLNGLCRMPLKKDTGWVLLLTQMVTKGGLAPVTLELAGLVRLVV